MLKEKQLRLIIRQELIKEITAPLGSYGISPKLTYKDKLLFGGYSVSQSFPGKNDNEIVIKMSETIDKKFSIDNAISLGARALSDDYLAKGSPFEQSLRSSLTNPESLSRNIAIAKLKNRDDINKSKSFNRSMHFFVVVDVNNKHLEDADSPYSSVKVKEYETNPGLVRLLINDPLRGYGQFIDQLPPVERDQFVSWLVKFNSLFSGISGIGEIAALTTSAPAAPAVAGISGAVAAGPSLALASIAYNKGNTLEAVMYFISAVVNTWTAASKVREGIAAYNTMGKWLTVKGSLSTLKTKIPSIQNIKDVFSLLKELSRSQALANEIKAGTPAADAFIYLIGSSSKLLEELTKLKDSTKSTLGLMFNFSLDTIGVAFDAAQLGETNQVTTVVSNIKEKESPEIVRAKIFRFISVIEQNISSMTGKKVTEFIAGPGQTLLLNYETGKSKLVKNFILGSVLDLNATVSLDLNIKNVSTDSTILIVPEYIFDTFDQLQNFPSSFSSTFSGNREKFFKDGKRIYMLDQI